MSSLGTSAAILLGATFVVAGTFKLTDGPAWLRQAADLGVPTWLAVVVPWFELVLGVTLISGVLSPWPGVLAIGTLLTFTGVIVLRLRDGSRPPCACFGARSAKPLSGRHVARNVVLLAVAVVAVVA